MECLTGNLDLATNIKTSAIMRIVTVRSDIMNFLVISTFQHNQDVKTLKTVHDMMVDD